MEDIPRKMALPPWNYSLTLDNGLKVSVNKLHSLSCQYSPKYAQIDAVDVVNADDSSPTGDGDGDACSVSVGHWA